MNGQGWAKPRKIPKDSERFLKTPKNAKNAAASVAARGIGRCFFHKKTANPTGH